MKTRLLLLLLIASVYGFVLSANVASGTGKTANHETGNYNDWGALTQQTVTRDSIEYYSAYYQYDGMLRIKHLTETVSGITTLYDNNNANQLNSYSWIQSGNTRLKEFSYNNSGQLTATANKTYYGNTPTTTSGKNFSYDIFGNLNAVTWANQSLTYKHDAFDRQIATYLNGAVKRKLVYGTGDLPLAELNENDRIINTFVYADGITPLLMRKGNTDYYIISDIRGSVRMVVKVSDGNILQQLDCDAFGKVISDSNPGYTPFGYAGGIYEYRTDLVRFGARDYFPEAGKWTAEDPIGFLSGGVNYYNYVSNDPVNYIDPTGLSERSTGESQRYDELVKAAQKLYPKKVKTEQHHPIPQYLGGAKNQKLVPLNGAYHQMITNAFRKRWGYGKGPLKEKELDEIINAVLQ